MLHTMSYFSPIICAAHQLLFTGAVSVILIFTDAMPHALQVSLDVTMETKRKSPEQVTCLNCQCEGRPVSCCVC